MTYSQTGEDDLIAPLLEGDGRYLSIGEYDGRTFSNVRLVAERGWEGVCVEPSAHAFAHLVKDPPPGAELVNALIGKRTGLSTFHYCTDALSTTEAKHAKKWSRITDFTPVYTVAVTLSDLLAELPGPYRLVGVDTEGTSGEIVKDLIPHLDELETEVLIYEHDGNRVNIPGFETFHENAENVIAVRR